MGEEDIIIVDIIIHGLILGGIYGLQSAGLTITFGVAKVINFSHGALYMLGAYATFLLINAFHFNVIIAAIMSCIILFLVGVGIDKICYRARESQALLILTFALAFIFEEIVRLTWGPEYHALKPFVEGSVTIFGVTVSSQRVLSLLISIILISVLWMFIMKTKLGKSMRATSENEELAIASGINTRKIYALSWGIGSALAAVAGILVGSVHMIYPSMGWSPSAKVICVVILGGLGNIKGSMVAAFFLGLLEISTSVLLFGELTDIISFVIVILTLVFRPAGIFGRRLL